MQLVWTPCATAGMDAMCDSDEGRLAVTAACAVIACRQTKRKRRCWTQPWLRRRQMSGAYYCSKPCLLYFPSPQRHAVLSGDAPSYGSTRYQCSINNRAHGTIRSGEIPGHPSAEHLAECWLLAVIGHIACHQESRLHGIEHSLLQETRYKQHETPSHETQLHAMYCVHEAIRLRPGCKRPCLLSHATALHSVKPALVSVK